MGAGRAAPDAGGAGQPVAGAEQLPAVEVADRLRRAAAVQVRSIDELFLVASSGRQVRHEPGGVIYEGGRVATDLRVPARSHRHADEGPEITEGLSA